MPTPGASESGVNETSTPDTARRGSSTSDRADRGSRRHRLRILARHRRFVVRSNPRWHGIYRIAVGTIGTIVLLCGIVAIPYPGPGWLIVFLGLGILASEFEWAHRLLKFARAKYDAWMEWMGRQHWSVQAVFWLGTCAIVIATLWVLGALHTVAGWVGLDYEWLASPVFG
ncbi:TIGR02611 family protein [Gordonia terrae]|uniref:TIGR02611 family protein n=1 Tax=Gordonia terrae TaxID=2055 RepID=A0A2I1RE06_9ACTN|nr:TIGR02611 family protein [Gordonia terrae]PKZ67372.1 TIGR02611 family protein [Gordonia terrae]